MSPQIQFETYFIVPQIYFFIYNEVTLLSKLIQIEWGVVTKKSFSLLLLSFLCYYTKLFLLVLYLAYTLLDKASWFCEPEWRDTFVQQDFIKFLLALQLNVQQKISFQNVFFYSTFEKIVGSYLIILILHKVKNIRKEGSDQDPI